MSQGKARPISSQNPSEVAIGIFNEGRDIPSKVIREPAPVGFLPELLPHLADFMARGFNAACDPEPDKVLDLSQLVPSPRGRRSDSDAELRAQQAVKLHSEGKTYRQIALRLCPKKQLKTHRCNKKCADRIRQEAKFYESKRYLDRLGQGEV
jgi:hypothetical protein